MITPVERSVENSTQYYVDKYTKLENTIHKLIQENQEIRSKVAALMAIVDAEQKLLEKALANTSPQKAINHGHLYN